MANQDFDDYNSDAKTYNAAMDKQQAEIAAKKAALQPIVNTPVAVPSSNCFVADENEKKQYVCPECQSVEGGSARIIAHRFNCKNKGKEYCQKGSKRSRTKKSKLSKSRSKKARKTRRSNK
jgi:hypothetical protein